MKSHLAECEIVKIDDSLRSAGQQRRCMSRGAGRHVWNGPEQRGAAFRPHDPTLSERPAAKSGQAPRISARAAKHRVIGMVLLQAMDRGPLDRAKGGRPGYRLMTFKTDLC